MPSVKLPAARIQLVATDTTELWIDLSRWLDTLGLLGFRGRIVLVDKQGNFSCRLGIQSYGADPELPNAALSITTGTGVGAITTVSKVFFDFDPTNANNGDTGANKEGARLGILYKSTSGVARGEVLLEFSARYA